ncbi:MAG: copper resistance protein NlpE N-terminal domain-containing protein [Bacteroidota bacterium]
MPRILLVLLFAASLAFAGCSEHYHGPAMTYEGTFNASSTIGGDKQITLNLYDNGTYVTRTVYTGQSFVPVVEAGSWELAEGGVVLHTERIDGEEVPKLATTYSISADDLEAVSTNGSPVDYVWAFSSGTKLSEYTLEAPKAHDDHGYESHDDEHAGDGHAGDEHGDDHHAEEDHDDDHSDGVAPAGEATASNA